MRFFKRSSEDDRRMTCPSCSQLIPVDATSCDMCGADLHDVPESRREAAVSSSLVSGSQNPYER